MLQGKKGVGSKSLHEKSRRAKQIVRVGLREEKLKEVRFPALFFGSSRFGTPSRRNHDGRGRVSTEVSSFAAGCRRSVV